MVITQFTQITWLRNSKINNNYFLRKNPYLFQKYLLTIPCINHYILYNFDFMIRYIYLISKLNILLQVKPFQLTNKSTIKQNKFNLFLKLL